MGRSLGFGSAAYNYVALLRLGFPSATHLQCLTSLYTTTRWPVLQKVRGRPYKGLPLIVNIWFQVLFHSPPGVLFTVPSRYCSLSVTREYLALGGGPPDFPQGFSCLVVLWILIGSFLVSSTGLSPSAADLSMSIRLRYLYSVYQSLTPVELPRLVWALSRSLAAT